MEDFDNNEDIGVEDEEGIEFNNQGNLMVDDDEDDELHQQFMQQLQNQPEISKKKGREDEEEDEMYEQFLGNNAPAA